MIWMLFEFLSSPTGRVCVRECARFPDRRDGDYTRTWEDGFHQCA